MAHTTALHTRMLIGFALGAGLGLLAHALAADSAREEKARDLHQPASPAQPGGRASSLHAFPRGPNPGTFLHGLLEMAAEEGFARLAGQPGQLRELIARRCQLRDLQAWPLAMSPELIHALLQTTARTHWSYDGRYRFIGNNCAVKAGACSTWR